HFVSLDASNRRAKQEQPCSVYKMGRSPQGTCKKFLRPGTVCEALLARSHPLTPDELLAEGVGFEPTIRFCRIRTFQARAFDRSATLPLIRRPGMTGRSGQSGENGAEPNQGRRRWQP